MKKLKCTDTQIQSELQKYKTANSQGNTDMPGKTVIHKIAEAKKKQGCLLLFAACVAVSLLTSCRPSGNHSPSELTIVYADGTDAEAAELQSELETRLTMNILAEEKTVKTVHVTAVGRERAVKDVLEGKADCGYGPVAAGDALQYGILKSQPSRKIQAAILADQTITAAADLAGQKLGYPDTLNDLFLAYIKGVENAELHSYHSVEQLLSDLDSGFLDAVILEEKAAEAVWLKSEALRFSQPFDLPDLEYRFWGTSQEQLGAVQEIWGTDLPTGQSAAWLTDQSTVGSEAGVLDPSTRKEE